jgi:GNAT superfamily N-acetyltransferase
MDLLHRVRLAHPTAGLWEAADYQWWWRTPRASDRVDQAFWLDGDGPVAAALLTEWRHGWGLDPIVAPGSNPAVLRQAVDEGLERAIRLGVAHVETLVRDDDEASRSLLSDRGFAATDDRGAVTWLAAERRPTPPNLPAEFELVDRRSAAEAPHPMVGRGGPDVGARLREVSLYDPELDLAVRHASGDIAGYALFWFDPVTRVGLVEPMRVEEPWQRRGLGRALLLHGLERLANRGATRLKVGYASEPGMALYIASGSRSRPPTRPGSATSADAPAGQSSARTSGSLAMVSTSNGWRNVSMTSSMPIAS